MTCSKYGINNAFTNPNPSDEELFEFIKDIVAVPKMLSVSP